MNCIGIDEEATMDLQEMRIDDFLFAGYGSKEGFIGTEDDILNDQGRGMRKRDLIRCVFRCSDEVSSITDSLDE